jgi:aminoglycoside phosphotransferase (APT) family kinase protein
VTLSPEAVTWIERETGDRVVGSEPMPPSGTEKDVVLLGSGRLLVLRRYTDRERYDDPWYVPANGAAALRMLVDTSVPAPELVAADPTGEVLDVPAILETFVEGAANFVPDDLDRYLASAAEVLVRIHDLDDRSGFPPYSAYMATFEIRAPVWSRDPPLWDRVREVLEGPPPSTPAGFIHRDYHGGNVLAVDDDVTAVVDWVTASIGPHGIDLARMRLNLLWEIDQEAADRFPAAYVAVGGRPQARHPFWDLADAADGILDWGEPEDAREAAQQARHEAYVASLLAELG